MIVSEGGQFPRTVSSLRKVPGVGEYTAGAIASIAFKEVSISCGHDLINEEQFLFILRGKKKKKQNSRSIV